MLSVFLEKENLVDNIFFPGSPDLDQNYTTNSIFNLENP